jgi:urease beta subunit
MTGGDKDLKVGSHVLFIGTMTALAFETNPEKPSQKTAGYLSGVEPVASQTHV